MATVGDTVGNNAPALATALFDYALPAQRIAQSPAQPRDSSRLLSLGADGAITDHRFTDLPALLRPGDLLVANDTRVRAARLRGHTEDGTLAEALLLDRLAEDRFTALVRPGRRLHAGAHLVAAGGLRITIAGRAPGHPGARVVTIDTPGDVESAIAAAGEPPLPPYIHQPLRDPGSYQTIYAAGAPASAAAPTAGLHFTNAVRRALAGRGIGWATLQLDVGLGTFAPMTAADAANHRMHAERCTLSPSTAAQIDAARAAGGRVIAVGTTTVRALEAHVDGRGRPAPGTLTTDLFITPGHRFAVVDGLLTNFHQPRSSLLVLLASLIGMEGWRRVYHHALTSGYRFLSFGDCMLCWGEVRAR